MCIRDSKNPAVPERILNQIKKKKAFSFPLAYDFNCIRDTRYYNSNISDEVKYLMVKGIGMISEVFTNRRKDSDNGIN